MSHHETPSQNKHTMGEGRIHVSEILDREAHNSTGRHHKGLAEPLTESNSEAFSKVMGFEPAEQPTPSVDNGGPMDQKFQESLAAFDGKQGQIPPRIWTPEDVDLFEADQAGADLAGPETPTPGANTSAGEAPAAEATPAQGPEQNDAEEASILEAMNQAAQEAETNKEISDDSLLSMLDDIHQEALNSQAQELRDGLAAETAALRDEKAELQQEISEFKKELEKLREKAKKARERKKDRRSLKDSLRGIMSRNESEVSSGAKLKPAGFFGKIFSKFRGALKSRESAKADHETEDLGQSEIVQYKDGSVSLLFGTDGSKLTLGEHSDHKYAKNFTNTGQDLVIIRTEGGREYGMYKGYILSQKGENTPYYNLPGGDIDVTVGKKVTLPGFGKVKVTSVELRYKESGTTTYDAARQVKSKGPFGKYIKTIDSINQKSGDN